MTKLQTTGRRLMRLKEAGEYVCLSPWKLRHIIQSGQIPIVKYGENTPWLVDVRDLDEWVQRNKHFVE